MENLAGKELSLKCRLPLRVRGAEPTVLRSVRSMKETGKACKRLAASIRRQVASSHESA